MAQIGRVRGRRNARLFAGPLLAVGTLLTVPAIAAPFCLTGQALPPYCIYQDASSCNREAQRQGLTCSVNTAEVKLRANVGQYCVVTPEKVSLCAFPDRQSCDVEAARLHSVCTHGPGIAPARTPDPYSPVNGY
ncbi:MAG TPA: hypothetical protein VN702_14830 [Acetobacteraceae bacterium]|nr:hypothetical protein [Acetobacteraceae bacterium]